MVRRQDKHTRTHTHTHTHYVPLEVDGLTAVRWLRCFGSTGGGGMDFLSKDLGEADGYVKEF